jgi:hypothetical protein
MPLIRRNFCCGNHVRCCEFFVLRESFLVLVTPAKAGVHFEILAMGPGLRRDDELFFPCHPGEPGSMVPSLDPGLRRDDELFFPCHPGEPGSMVPSLDPGLRRDDESELAVVALF